MVEKQPVPRNVAAGVVRALQEWAYESDVQVEFGGSWRRGAAYLGDVDMVVWGEAVTDLIWPPEIGWSRRGPSVASGIWAPLGVQVDAWSVVDPAARGAFMWFITGPKQLNVAMRAKAARMGLQLSQYGLYDKTQDGNPRVPGTETEEGLAEALGWPWSEPVDRDGWSRR